MRFLTAAEIDGAGRAGWIGRAVDWVLSRAHRYLMSSEAVRVALGAGVGTAEDPEDLEHYEPPIDYGGLLDSRQRAVEFYARGGEAAKAG